VLNYQPGFSPSAPPPARQKPFLGQVPLVSAVQPLVFSPQSARALGARHRSIGQTFDQIMGWHPAAGDILRLLFHGGTTWLGIRVGSSEKNKWVSGIAWVLAVGNGLAGIADLISLAKRVTGTHPPDPCAPKAPVTSPEPAPALPSAGLPGSRSF